MTADATIVSLRSDTAEAPATRRPNAPREQPEWPSREHPEQPPRVQPEPPVDSSSQPPRRRRLRWGLFALLPLALIAGGYWYVTGGRVMSTDNAYVEADKVGISTDVSGIVKEIDVGNNQPVKEGQVLFRLDNLPFRLALERTDAQVGTVRNDLNALKANYQDMLAQIKQAQYDIEYYDREFHRRKPSLRPAWRSRSITARFIAKPKRRRNRVAISVGPLGLRRRLQSGHRLAADLRSRP